MTDVVAIELKNNNNNCILKLQLKEKPVGDRPSTKSPSFVSGILEMKARRFCFNSNLNLNLFFFKKIIFFKFSNRHDQLSIGKQVILI